MIIMSDPNNNSTISVRDILLQPEKHLEPMTLDLMLIPDAVTGVLTAIGHGGCVNCFLNFCDIIAWAVRDSITPNEERTKFVAEAVQQLGVILDGKEPQLIVTIDQEVLWSRIVDKIILRFGMTKFSTEDFLEIDFYMECLSNMIGRTSIGDSPVVTLYGEVADDSWLHNVQRFVYNYLRRYFTQETMNEVITDPTIFEFMEGEAFHA